VGRGHVRAAGVRHPDVGAVGAGGDLTDDCEKRLYCLGAGTAGKPAGDTSPLHWYVRDNLGGQVGLGETCVSNDTYNNLPIRIENTSNTGTNAKVFGAVTGSGGWNIASSPGTDTFAIQARLGTNGQHMLGNLAVELTDTTRLAKGADQALVLTVMTPLSITNTANLGVEKTIFATLTASPE